ncbi:alpha,alpha-trehalase [Chitinophagaceae bacterium LB-8]|uniref:Alpha,alpha-trehalase n=1 Tax=Paraflavisolibacter caeni TaxID=2982496 RepID=A0A9X3BH73_9BACT|nr:glycosyl hydrolase family 65 protein [Paraflavisolibacter caeni]MCU7552009.1 alpha,alpha-trehalase [Paraflavisolibacter caeni]
MKQLFSFKTLVLFFTVLQGTSGLAQVSSQASFSISKLKNYSDYFNSIDTETVQNFVPNDQAFQWLSNNVPLFECPDSVLEKIYYYRWWCVRKHLKQTPDGFVFTEFITPVNHAGKYNTVSSALGHHIYEGRWLRKSEYMKDYISFWLYVDKKTPKPHLHAFSSWLQNAVYNWYLVTQDQKYVQDILLTLNEDYMQWEAEKGLPNKMFWQFDVRDAMEESISGSRKQKNVRPTINSYMYGNAVAMAKMAAIVGNDTLQKKYNQKATDLKALVQQQLWDDTASFFKAQYENGNLCDAREAIDFIPWYFNLPDDEKKYAAQWDQIIDTAGFDAPWGLTTAERRHPLFRTHGTGHGCEWDGAIWPFATTQTLKGLSNLLTQYKHKGKMTPEVFYDELYTYAWSHQKRGLPYLGEYQDEKNGEWLKGDNPRSSYYNHSSFADLIINDLIGLKPRADNVLKVQPLIPEGKWDWFYLDKVPYHGKLLTIFWDKDGHKYGKGKGFYIYADGKEIYKGKKLKAVTAKL